MHYVFNFDDLFLIKRKIQQIVWFFVLYVLLFAFRLYYCIFIVSVDSSAVKIENNSM